MSTTRTKRGATARFLALFSSLAMIVIGLVGVVVASPASATPSGPVTICHATASYDNPYVVITVNTSSVKEMERFFKEQGENGHGTHTGKVFDPTTNKSGDNWGDIIPPSPTSPSTASTRRRSSSTAASTPTPEPAFWPTAVRCRPTPTPSRRR